MKASEKSKEDVLVKDGLAGVSKKEVVQVGDENPDYKDNVEYQEMQKSLKQAQAGKK